MRFMPVLYRDNRRWVDVPKIPQDDGPAPVVRIAYSERFSDVMDCFRGVMHTKELSERALELTKAVIDANPANYTAWYYRRQCLDALQADLTAELEFTERMALEHPKNYQIWHHRREICSRVHDGSKEKAFCARAIEDDSKNYHAWSYRQWVLRTYGLWEGELEYIDELLHDDVRNNSAWNQRWFVLQHTTEMTLADRQREVDYTLAKIECAVHNESPWNYLRGMIRGFEADFAGMLKDKCLAWQAEYPNCVFVDAMLVDLYAQEGTPEAIAAAKELLNKLMNDTDQVRQAYWQLRLTTLTSGSK